MRGNITKRGEKAYLVRISMGRDARGRRLYHSKTIHGTKKDAQNYLTAALRKLQLGESLDRSVELLRDFLPRWLETAVRPRVELRTWEEYEVIVRNRIVPSLGDLRLSQLKADRIQEWVNTLAETLSPRSVQYSLQTLSNALKQAVAWELIPKNPCAGISLPKQRPREVTVLTPAQAREFFKACEGNYYALLYRLMAQMGLRVEEVTGLTWDCVDWDNSRLHVRQALVWPLAGGWLLRPTKTAGSRRSLPLSSSLVAALREQRRASLEMSLRLPADVRGFVFISVTGQPIRANTLRSDFKRVLRRAELPEVRLYDLRASFATMMLESGHNLKHVSRALGHSDVRTTARHYLTVTEEADRRASETMESLLFAPEVNGR
jgi:integrase